MKTKIKNWVRLPPSRPPKKNSMTQVPLESSSEIIFCNNIRICCFDKVILLQKWIHTKFAYIVVIIALRRVFKMFIYYNSINFHLFVCFVTLVTAALESWGRGVVRQPKTIQTPMWGFSKLVNSIGLVFSEILQDKQTNTLYNKDIKKIYCIQKEVRINYFVFGVISKIISIVTSTS